MKIKPKRAPKTPLKTVRGKKGALFTYNPNVIQVRKIQEDLYELTIVRHFTK